MRSGVVRNDRVAEEGDELARLQGAVHDVMRAEERDDAGQDRGQEHLARLESGLGRGDAVAGDAHSLALAR